MEKEFIPYEQALALKELEFDEPCLGFYIASQLFVTSDTVYNSSDIPVCKAPLYQQAFRWFREKYDLFGIVEGKGYDHKKYYIYSIKGKWHPLQPGFDKPEQAELECLKKLIEIVKNK